MTRRRTQGDGGLYKTANGLWRGSIEVPATDGKRRRRVVSSRDRNAAMAKLRELRRKVEQGALPISGSTTVQAWLQRWLEDIHGPTVRPTTAKSYSNTIRLYINPHIGAKKLHKLTAEDVRGMHKLVQAKTTRGAEKAHQVLGRALGDAVKEGMIARNVVEVVNKPRHTPAERLPLSAEQAKTLLRSCIEHDDPYTTRWAAALLLGARQGELLGLTWDRVDLESGLVDLAWQLQQLQQSHGCGDKQGDEWPCGRVRPGWCPGRKWDMPAGFEYKVIHRSLALTRPKSRSGKRVVPLPLPLWAMLKAHADGSAGANPHALVWHEHGRPIGPRADYENWQNALLRAELRTAEKASAIPLHCARHTTATLLLEAGVSEDIRMAIMGQSSVVAQRGYAHIDQTQTRAALANLDQLLA